MMKKKLYFPIALIILTLIFTSCVNTEKQVRNDCKVIYPNFEETVHHSPYIIEGKFISSSENDDHTKYKFTVTKQIKGEISSA